MNTLSMRLRAQVVLVAAAMVAVGAQAAPKVDATKVGQGISKFGFSLFQSIHGEKLGEPTAISPMSLAEALSLTTQGSEKDTKKELEKLFGTDAATTAQGVKAIRESLLKFAKESNGAFQYTSANALWGNSNVEWDFKFKPNFLKTAGDLYGAQLTSEDFAVPATVTNINNWVNKHTNGKIPELLQQLDKNAVAVLLNAIYTKGRFANHFYEMEEGNYTTASGATKNATYMTKTEYMGQYKDKDMSVYSFAVQDKGPKAVGGQIALDVIVPAKGNLDALITSLNSTSYAKAVKGLKVTEIKLTMPAGKVEQSEALKLGELLQKKPYSLVRSFDGDAAQFGPMGSTAKDHNLYISDVLTRTFYQVTPFGFEAAAATAVAMAAATAVPAPPPVVKIEGAAVHVIRHVPTGTPLFISVYDSPQLYTENEIVDLVEEGIKTSHHLSAKVAGGRIQEQYDFTTGKSSIALVNDNGEVVKVYKSL